MSVIVRDSLMKQGVALTGHNTTGSPSAAS